jgi:hypothetical protein
MAGGGSRGIHAARPTPRRLRSACTQVAMGVVWTIAYEIKIKIKINGNGNGKHRICSSTAGRRSVCRR